MHGLCFQRNSTFGKSLWATRAGAFLTSRKTRFRLSKTVSFSFLVNRNVTILFFSTPTVPGLDFWSLCGYVVVVLRRGLEAFSAKHFGLDSILFEVLGTTEILVCQNATFDIV